MNIAFAKIGKSIKFKHVKNSYGGDNEPPAILRALANNNPDKTFYLVGRSDFSRLSMIEKAKAFPYNNVIDCYEGVGGLTDNPEYLIDFIKNNKINIDFGIMMIGQIGSVTIPNKVEQVNDRTKTAAVIDMTKNYSTPVINWLNESNTKWVQIINDPRYTMAQTRDFINKPILSLSQYDYSYIHNRIKSFEDQDRIEEKHDVKYVEGIETAFCIDRQLPSIKNIEKTKKFVIILNEGHPSRYNQLKEWVLDYNKDVDIYGKWDCKESMNDNRFKGLVSLDDVQRIARSTKYTFIIPIQKGWVTSKYIEMIHAGCIPFFHPSYDEQQHLNVPDVLRLKKPVDLYRSIEFLESNPDVMATLLNELQKILKKEYYDGSLMNDTIMKESYAALNMSYVKPNIEQFTKQEFVTLF